MGAILNRFDKLMELKNSPEYMGRFKLSAVIVHNPDDVELCEHIRENFLDFAEMTGDNFLFITFIQPPNQYLDGLKKGQFHRASLIISDRIQGNEIERLVAPQLCELYKLDDKKSYLILSEKLLDNRYYKIPITTASLPYQLLRIKNYCNHPDNLDSLIKSLEGELCNSKEILFDNLLKLVSLISPPPKVGEYGLHYWSQKELAFQTIRENKDKLMLSIKSLRKDQTESILNLYKLIEYTYHNVFMADQPKSKKPQGYSHLDGKSKKFWDTCERLMCNISKDERDALDYSAFTLYFGKIIESELNLSVGQMLRHAMGIDMPAYYNRYCPQKGTVTIPTLKLKISINKKSKGNAQALEGVPMGNLLHAYKTAIGEELPAYNWQIVKPDNIEQLPADFLVFWENFAQIRNSAAHTGIIDEIAFNTAFNEFQVFLSSYLGYLFSIKTSLKPNAQKC